MMILAMHLEMIHELQNTLAKDRYLNLWRTGVGLVSPVFCDYFVFGIGRQCHARIDTPRLVLISFFLLQHSTIGKRWAVERLGSWRGVGQIAGVGILRTGGGCDVRKRTEPDF